MSVETYKSFSFVRKYLAFIDWATKVKTYKIFSLKEFSFIKTCKLDEKFLGYTGMPDYFYPK